MKLSNKLIATGRLGRHNTTHSPEWEYLLPRQPRISDRTPAGEVLVRRERSIKVTARGWKVLRHVLYS